MGPLITIDTPQHEESENAANNWSDGQDTWRDATKASIRQCHRHRHRHCHCHGLCHKTIIVLKLIEKKNNKYSGTSSRSSTLRRMWPSGNELMGRPSCLHRLKILRWDLSHHYDVWTRELFRGLRIRWISCQINNCTSGGNTACRAIGGGRRDKYQRGSSSGAGNCFGHSGFKELA